MTAVPSKIVPMNPGPMSTTLSSPGDTKVAVAIDSNEMVTADDLQIIQMQPPASNVSSLDLSRLMLELDDSIEKHAEEIEHASRRRGLLGLRSSV